MRKLLLSFFLCGIALLVTACGKYEIPDEGPPQAQDTETTDPFAAADESGSFLGFISHGPTGFLPSVPLEYDGGEATLDYHFSAEGEMKTIGFLLFLDGKPQPYKVGASDAAYEYCHTFDAMDGTEENVTFRFVPQCGTAGDTLGLTVVSITRPDFRPDMQNSSSYGWYHQALNCKMQLHFNADAPAKEDVIQPLTLFTTINVSEEKATSEYVEKELGKNGWNNVSMDSLDDGIYYTLTYNGDIVYDNICVSELEQLIIRSTICGAPGANYTLSFFIDNRPVASTDTAFISASLTKGNVWVVDAAINIEKLEDFSTFYMMLIPSDRDDPVYKSQSILLYKEKR